MIPAESQPPPPKEEGQRPKDSLLMSLLAAIAFIIWGLYVNWDHGWSTRLQVAGTQGLISLISTFFAAELIVALVTKFKNHRFPVFFGGLSSYLILYSLILGGHFVAGTPEFWPTVLPGMTTGLFFSFGYALRVAKKLRIS